QNDDKPREFAVLSNGNTFHPRFRSKSELGSRSYGFFENVQRMAHILTYAKIVHNKTASSNEQILENQRNLEKFFHNQAIFARRKIESRPSLIYEEIDKADHESLAAIAYILDVVNVQSEKKDSITPAQYALEKLQLTQSALE